MKTKIFIYIITMLLPIWGFGQDILDTDSYIPTVASTARAIPYPIASDELDIQEMIKIFPYEYHKPSNDNVITMQAAFSAKNINDKSGKTVLELALKAKDYHSLLNSPQVNVSLVIDKSGSMKEEQRMERLKQAIHIFIDKLRADDIISLVVYDTEPYVLISARKVGDKSQLHQAVNLITPEGNTNLNGGMLYGYEEVLKNSMNYKTNKVILFTDGVANIGVTKPERIISLAKQFNKLGIDLSTIGFGKELQFSLLKKLARNGNGKAYYVKNTEDLQTVFIQEAENLISPVARDVTLEIRTNEAIFVREVYGYECRQTGGGADISLPNFHANQSATLLIELEKGQGRYKGKTFPVSIGLRYFDIQQQKTVNYPLNLEINYLANGKEAFLGEENIQKKYLYALGTSGLIKAASAYENGDVDYAFEVLTRTDKTIQSFYSIKLPQELQPIHQLLQECKNYLITFSGKQAQ